MIEDFSSEFTRDDIHVRDHSQFELKSEFFINPLLKKNVFKQEFYLFIPSQLQINSDTYTKRNFYLDQTNLIRYKTPRISLADLTNPLYTQSPLYRLNQFAKSERPLERLAKALDELKLFASIFKSALRERVYQLAHTFDNPTSTDLEAFPRAIAELCMDVKDVCEGFRAIQESVILALPNNQLKRHFKYVDEFISNTIDEYLTLLEYELEKHSPSYSEDSKKLICQIILHEKLYREEHHLGPKTSKEKLFSNESILHRQGLLNRFVLEALMLKSYRSSLEEKHGNVFSAIAAGIAMSVYMILYNWNSTFVTTSFTFIMLVVIIYMLRDTIKDFLKKVFVEKASRWLHDYSTEIKSPKGTKIGRLTENFAYVDLKNLPPGFLEIRNYHFNEELQALQRHETIIQYKREITLLQHPSDEGRRHELTMIFRLNIDRFVRDASDALQPNLKLDAYTQEISERLLPKVYHLNLIIRNSYIDSDNLQKSEIKKYRVVLDKSGIKRVEQIVPTGKGLSK